MHPPPSAKRSLAGLPVSGSKIAVSDANRRDQDSSKGVCDATDAWLYRVLIAGASREMDQNPTSVNARVLAALCTGLADALEAVPNAE